MTHDDTPAGDAWQAQRARLVTHLAATLGDDPHAGEPPWADPAVCRYAARANQQMALGSYGPKAIIATPWTDWPHPIRDLVTDSLAGLTLGGLYACDLHTHPEHATTPAIIVLAADTPGVVACSDCAPEEFPDPITCAVCGDLATDAVLYLHGRIAISAGLCSPHTDETLTTERTHRAAAADTLHGTHNTLEDSCPTFGSGTARQGSE